MLVQITIQLLLGKTHEHIPYSSNGDTCYILCSRPGYRYETPYRNNSSVRGCSECGAEGYFPAYKECFAICIGCRSWMG